MRDLLLLAVQLVVSLARLARPGGVRSVIAESLLLKHQLIISGRSRRRAPPLTCEPASNIDQNSSIVRVETISCSAGRRPISSPVHSSDIILFDSISHRSIETLRL
jgi:hypothetical protein